MYIDDAPFLTVAQLRSKARQFKRRHGLKLIVVDYVQLLSGSHRNENRIAELSEITRHLKATAKDLNVPIVVLSQLSRAVESREDKRPALSDLRESGSIEQDADVVMFIYREEYYLQRSEPLVNFLPTDTEEMKISKKLNDPKWKAWNEQLQKVKNLGAVIISKNRHGPTANVILRFNPERTCFENLSSASQIPR